MLIGAEWTKVDLLVPVFWASKLPKPPDYQHLCSQIGSQKNWVTLTLAEFTFLYNLLFYGSPAHELFYNSQDSTRFSKWKSRITWRIQFCIVTDFFILFLFFCIKKGLIFCLWDVTICPFLFINHSFDYMLSLFKQNIEGERMRKEIDHLMCHFCEFVLFLWQMNCVITWQCLNQRSALNCCFFFFTWHW